MDGSSRQQPDSGALIRQPRASFQQQGQFDWFALAKSTVNWAVDVIARLSAAGVDQSTAIVARNMCHLFKLAPIGRRNMHDALMELACFQSLSEVVWFGIGTKYLVRDLAVTEQGTLCVGLCAGLSSCYSESIAAEIFAEMVSVSEAPVQLTPSISEWKKLIHGCNGALHTSSFPLHAERLMSLFPTLQPFTESGRSGPICSLPSSLAKALLAIGDVSRGILTAIVHNENNMYETMWQDPHTTHKWPRHSDAAHGRGFINSIIYWFPELESMQEVMEESVRLSYSDARSVYETLLSLVHNTCLCDFCRDNFPRNSKGSGFCKVVILETIVYLGQMLSAVSADRRLGLKRHGVEAIYELILFKRMSSGPDPGILQEIHGALHFSLCYSDLRQLHFAVLALFAGEAAERPSYTLGTSAYSQAGICTYLHILCEVTDSKELIGQIHVIPGRIEYHGRPYDSLLDGGPLAMHMRGLYRPDQTDSQRLKHKD